ncbi:hypothetical protein [Maricaulis maris]|jgi:hypothetical protein|uniref:hypothetical protein n=1 Tax=Maricaulis maris TaxID=74318 RepID=UPI002924A9C0|nr:hypothetical protein MACH15_16720 [Maricaulis maris]
MTDERFFQILEAYGADPARWPADERAEAEAFALGHPDLIADAAQSERDLDALLDQLIEPERASPLLERRLLAQLPVPALPSWMAPSAIAAALLVGAFIGFASGAMTVPGDTGDAIYADAFTGYEQDWTDWLGEDA